MFRVRQLLFLLAFAALPLGSALADQVLHFNPPRKGPAVARAVLITGDGGRSLIERSIAHRLSGDDIDVVTLDSRSYFASERSLKWIAGSLDALSRTPRPSPVLLIGYSFGADLIPLVWPDLEKSTRARISTVALVSPTHDASSVVDPTGHYDPKTMRMVALASHLGHLPTDRLTCISGRDEVASGYSSCLDAAFAGATVIELDGGHDFGGNPKAVADTVAELAAQAIRGHAPRVGPAVGNRERRISRAP